MSRSAVRAAVAQYLTDANITFLGTVFEHPPRVTKESDIMAGGAPGTGSGVVIYVHFGHQQERRIELSGPGRGKMVTYTATLVCVLRCMKTHAEQADSDNDTFIDSLTTAIRANLNAGDSNAVFQWGEGNTLYGTDIQVDTDMPKTVREQVTQVWNTVRVTVMEKL